MPARRVTRLAAESPRGNRGNGMTIQGALAIGAATLGTALGAR
jgi:hypothetical protein